MNKLSLAQRQEARQALIGAIVGKFLNKVYNVDDQKYYSVEDSEAYAAVDPDERLALEYRGFNFVGEAAKLLEMTESLDTILLYPTEFLLANLIACKTFDRESIERELALAEKLIRAEENVVLRLEHPPIFVRDGDDLKLEKTPGPKLISSKDARKLIDPEELSKRLDEYDKIVGEGGDDPQVLHDIMDGAWWYPDLFYLNEADSELKEKDSRIYIVMKVSKWYLTQIDELNRINDEYKVAKSSPPKVEEPVEKPPMEEQEEPAVEEPVEEELKPGAKVEEPVEPPMEEELKSGYEEEEPVDEEPPMEEELKPGYEEEQQEEEQQEKDIKIVPRRAQEKSKTGIMGRAGGSLVRKPARETTVDKGKIKKGKQEDERQKQLDTWANITVENIVKDMLKNCEARKEKNRENVYLATFGPDGKRLVQPTKKIKLEKNAFNMSTGSIVAYKSTSNQLAERFNDSVKFTNIENSYTQLVLDITKHKIEFEPPARTGSSTREVSKARNNFITSQRILTRAFAIFLEKCNFAKAQVGEFVERELDEKLDMLDELSEASIREDEEEEGEVTLGRPPIREASVGFFPEIIMSLPTLPESAENIVGGALPEIQRRDELVAEKVKYLEPSSRVQDLEVIVAKATAMREQFKISSTLERARAQGLGVQPVKVKRSTQPFKLSIARAIEPRMAVEVRGMPTQPTIASDVEEVDGDVEEEELDAE
jgi:hypothetical protein